MVERRMFPKVIINSQMLFSMPSSIQPLYFHLIKIYDTSAKQKKYDDSKRLQQAKNKIMGVSERLQTKFLNSLICTVNLYDKLL